MAMRVFIFVAQGRVSLGMEVLEYALIFDGRLSDLQFVLCVESADGGLINGDVSFQRE